MNPKITELKEDIDILQEKLHKLEEIEKRNAIPRMNLENEGKFDMVTYNNDIFYRLEYPTSALWYKRKGNMLTDVVLKLITDRETHRLLEGVWYNDVQIKREKRAVQSTNWEPNPQSPEEVEEGLRAAMRQAKEDGVFDNVVDEPLEYDEIEHDISDNVENKTIKEVINRWWMDTFSPKNMWPIGESIDDLADQIEFWVLRNKK